MKRILFLTIVTLISSCSITDYKQGEGASPVTGSSSLNGGSGENATLVKCTQPLGTATLVEPQGASYTMYGLQSPTILVRLMMQQSNCFIVVDRGAAMANMMTERQLDKSGELRSNSSFGGGQMVSADFSITPNIVFTENNSAGASLGLALGSMIPYAGPLIGAFGAVAQLKFKCELRANTQMIPKKHCCS